MELTITDVERFTMIDQMKLEKRLEMCSQPLRLKFECGLVQNIVEMRIDDDQDCVWLRVRVGGNGASCHVGYRSCFYRSLPTGDLPNAPVTLTFEETEKVFDPLAVYGDAPNPTKL